VLLDFRFGLVIQDGDERDKLHVTLATTFSACVAPDAPAKRYEPKQSDPTLGILAVAVRFQRVTSCRITSDATLRLDFASGLVIQAPPSQDYEAWQLDYSNPWVPNIQSRLDQAPDEAEGVGSRRSC